MKGKKEKSEYEKISEYYSKITKIRNNNYKDYLQKGIYCDILSNGEWKIGYVLEKTDYYLTIVDYEQYYLYNNEVTYQRYYSEEVSYFRKFTHPSLNNAVSERSNKNDLAKKIKNLQQNDFINLFKDTNEDLTDPSRPYKIYYFLRATLGLGFDRVISRSKDKNSGVEEGFKIILITLEYLAEFFKYINNNFDDFINYKNELSNSELSDLVLIEKKYAIFSFWDDANYLMNKIFFNNENYLEWFVDSEKILQKIIPSSPNFKKVDKKILYPLYSSQVQSLKNVEYNYKSFNGQNLILNNICKKTDYEGRYILINQTKLPVYIIAYFIDYFYALGGFNALFSMCKNFCNVTYMLNIFDNICLAEEFTDSFSGKFEEEKNLISSNLMKFMEELKEDNYNKYSKDLIVKLIKKGCSLFPKNQKKNSFFFEELYLKYILKLFIYNKNEKKKIEILNDLINILSSIEYNDIFNENKKANDVTNNINDKEKKNIDEIINNEKYNKRDKLIKEMNYTHFCSYLKNSNLIENVFNNPKLSEDIIETFLPILIIMYNNYFGYESPDKSIKEINSLKNLVFNKILSRIKIAERDDINNLNKLQKILCDFCEVLIDEDKYFIFSELKTIFYNSMYNQNNSFKYFFDFMINFTSTSVKKINTLIPNKENKNEINKNNINFDEKKFYGLELICGFLTEEQYKQFNYDEKQKKEMINICIDGIIKIITNCKNQELGIYIILNKIFNSTKNQKDVVSNLLLLQKLINYYNKNNNNLFDDILKNMNLFLLLISELKEYLKKIKKQKIQDINSIEHSEYNNNINNLSEDNKYNIKIRIEAIFCLMPNYTKNNFDFKNVKDFIQMVVQYDIYSRDICYECLLNSINNYSKDFLFYVNSDIISKEEIFDIRNLKAYQIYKKIIIKINMINNNYFSLYNKDMMILINEGVEFDKEIKGIDTLWNLLLNEEQNIDINIINDITDFICDLFFGIRIKSDKNLNTVYKTFFEDFINNVSQKLNSLLISKKNKKNIKAVKSLILLIKKIINKCKNIEGEVIKNIKELIPNKNNDDQDNTVEFTFFGTKSLSDSSYFCDLKIRKDECFHALRYTLSFLYKIPVNQISISVYMNNLGKSELNQKNLEKIMKTSPLKQFNLYNDFDNIYHQLKGSLAFSQSKKKSSLLIQVKCIKNIWEEIYKINPLDIIYTSSKLSLMFLSLLKGKEEPYTYDIINIIKDNSDLFNKAISDEIEKEMKNKNMGSLFNLENTSIYYINCITDNLYEIINKNYKGFMKSSLFNNYIIKLNILDDNGYKFDSKGKLPDLNDIYIKYKLCNSLLNIYKLISNNEKDENIFSFSVFRILNLYYYIINDSININLTKCSSSKGIKINDIKNFYEEILNNINEIILNNEKIFSFIIKCLVNKDKKNFNDYINKIRNIFMYISFDSLIKNKFSFINKKIKSLIIGITNKNNSNINLFFEFLFEFYLSENSFNKIIKIYQEINNNNIINNNKRYEKNAKNFYDISSQVLSLIFGYIKEKININEYIQKILMPKIFNYTKFITQNFPPLSIYPQLIIGGACKLYTKIITLINIETNEKNNAEFIFNNFIMPNIKENILNPQNVFNLDKNKNNNSIYITSSFCIKEASNLFIALLFKNSKENNNAYIEYLNLLNKYHNFDYWKGNLLSDWKLYYKSSEKMTGYIGLKNLGSTCYINTILQIFYNIPLLREGLLSCETPFSGGKNALYQLKKVFYSLRYLQTNYYTPTSFVENFDNEKLDPKIQMDIFEFFCNFLEKIEKRLKNTLNENLLNYFFMGIQNDILSFEKPCQHHRINQSKFYTIQLQVQNKFNLYESLDSFIEGEKMDGDNCIFCEKCNRKMPAVKSQNFQELPRILIFVLKRFEFNYNTMQKFKINDYYEFPMELNMDKYVQKTNSNNNINNLYKLKSIVVHSGSCESGHYYSYILEDKTGDWYEFNDIKISKFDIKKLDIEAFSKNEIINENGNKIEKENTRNAYMLFYEKVDFNKGIKFDKINVINNLKGENEDNDDNFNLLNDNDDLDEKKGIIKTEFNSKIITEKIKTEEINDILKPMNKEMYEFFLNKRLFSGEYHHFILSLFINILNSYKISLNNKLSFNYDSCINDNNYVLGNDIKDFKNDRKNPAISNINNYLSKQKIILINKIDKNMTQIENKEDEKKILEIFQFLIIYFFNVMIRAREKDYLGGTVDLIKYFVNNYLYCADYLIEEFSNQNVLIEYMINCPSYDVKKLIVGILYCAMINSIKSYENKMRMINKQNEKNKKTKKDDNKKKKIEVMKSDQPEQTMDDEELARRLQEEENYGYSQQAWNNDDDEGGKNKNKYYDDLEEVSNPLERKYIPMNVVKLIYNILHLLRQIKYQNMNESRFLYLIIYRFSTISKKCKKFLLNKALVLEFLNILLFEDLKQENHNDSKIIKTMNRGCFTAPHSILFSNKKEKNAIYDKGGAFHYENYISELYYYLLSHNQKPKPKRPYFEGSFNFDNKSFVKALFFRINTRLDAYVFSYLITQKCKNPKNYKQRIECILENLSNILKRADFNENIDYDINSNRDVFNHNTYNSRDRNTFDYENEIPKINPKYILLILKKFMLNSSENKKIDEFRITQCLSKFFEITEENQKYYNFSILLIDFITELITNNMPIFHSYITQYSPNIKSLLDWIRLNPISPELYPIEGISMYKSDNVAYKHNISEEEKKSFDEENMKRAELRANKLNKILEYKSYYSSTQNKFGNDFAYEALFDYTDFKFRKGDYIYYNKKRAIIIESLDELILIKIIWNENIIKNKDYDEDGYSIDEMEKIKFWVAKDDKNISIFSLE